MFVPLENTNYNPSENHRPYSKNHSHKVVLQFTFFFPVSLVKRLFSMLYSNFFSKLNYHSELLDL